MARFSLWVGIVAYLAVGATAVQPSLVWTRVEPSYHFVMYGSMHQLLLDLVKAWYFSCKRFTFVFSFMLVSSC